MDRNIPARWAIPASSPRADLPVAIKSTSAIAARPPYCLSSCLSNCLSSYLSGCLSNCLSGYLSECCFPEFKDHSQSKDRAIRILGRISTFNTFHTKSLRTLQKDMSKDMSMDGLAVRLQESFGSMGKSLFLAILASIRLVRLAPSQRDRTFL